MATGNNGSAKRWTLSDLRDELRTTTFAFRGYNVTNLGRTPELLAHPEIGPIVRRYLARGSDVCGQVSGRRVDLVQRVEQQRETSLASYDEAIALIVAVEMAQMEAIRQLYDIDVRKAPFLFGFSLGEIAALVAAGSFEMEDALRIPLAMAHDAVELALDVTLGVLFSRRGNLSLAAVLRMCQEINLEGNGVIGVSALLAPNSMLLIGQGTTVERFSKRMSELSKERVHMRRNEHLWPPLHTPITWQRHIPDRSRNLMHTMPGALTAPQPHVFSLVTGSLAYTDSNIRELIGRWIDHPQRLWDAVEYTLSAGMETVVHVGPQANIIPATFQRLSANVEAQTKGNMSIRAMSSFARRPWLKNMLPKRASLLRAPMVRHVFLEDLLLDKTLATVKK
jgi:[acyl-carrier-protein] S-malonyltransferase